MVGGFLSNGTVPRSVRLDKENAEWFDRNFPWRGSLPQFLNAAITHFRKEWGDREPADEVLIKAMQRLGSGF